MKRLGNWALIDIETTGIDPTYDEIIDIGFLQFDGTTLVKQYSSLVRSHTKIPQFIQKLTGISEDSLCAAPRWDDVKKELINLQSHDLLAHNSDFEEKFLDNDFARLLNTEEREKFHDSMYYLGLLFPGRAQLNLEAFITDFKIADKEIHRGLEDSIDLLKVLLVATSLVQQSPSRLDHLKNLFKDFPELWYSRLLYLDEDELAKIASAVDFDLFAHMALLAPTELAGQQQGEKLDVSSEFSGKNIQNLLQDEEQMRKLFSGYVHRAPQEQMALKVGQSFKNNIHALIQAPTGTGKTLAYLLPSFLKVLDEKSQVLIATGTKALQTQAVEQDIPMALKMFSKQKDQLKIVKLIGSQNHLCELFFRNKTQGELLSFSEDFPVKFAHNYLESAFFHNRNAKTAAELVTIEDFPYVFKRKFPYFAETIEEVGVDYRSCIGSRCPFSSDCSYIRTLREAQEANIIVGNHSMLLHWPRSMEKPPYIVIDEAHRLEGEATSAYTLELKQRELEQLAKNLPSMVGPLYYLLSDQEEELSQRLRSEISRLSQMMQDHLPGLEENITRYMKKLPRYTDLYWNELKLLGEKSLNSNVEAGIYNHLKSLSFIFKESYELLLGYLRRVEHKKNEDEDTLVAFAAFEKLLDSTGDGSKVFESILTEGDLWANTINFHEEMGYTLQSSPINVGELIHENILRPAASVVYTSATLGNHTGDMGASSVEWTTGYKYLAGERRFKTPFFLNNNYNYQENVKVFLATEGPSTFERDFVEKTLESVAPLIEKIQGGALLLFSSKQRFEKATEIMLSKFEGNIPIFVQGTSNNIVNDFKKEERAILVGMESLSEGIDIPGEQLELVYIDKVPDIRREYVIEKRRAFYEREFGNEFVDYFLANRTRSLHQKLGRLMRRKEDRGCVIITDSRVGRWKGRTLQSFRQLMLPYEIQLTSLKDACQKSEDFITKK